MATVIDLEAWRLEAWRRHHGRRVDHGVDRLELAVERLDPLVATSGQHRVPSSVETEILAIMGAISSGLYEEALERLERLTNRLEHPSSRAKLG